MLGYSLLPMVLLSTLGAILHLKYPPPHACKLTQVSGWIGLIVVGVSVVWCTFASSGMFAAYMNASDQRLLIAYPVSLFYGAFAMLAVF